MTCGGKFSLTDADADGGTRLEEARRKTGAICTGALMLLYSV